MMPSHWELCGHPPGVIADPDQLSKVSSDWFPAKVPGTVASALSAAGRWRLGERIEADASDWWFRTSFTADKPAGRLCFDGLATLAEVWLNGEKILTSDNMFRSYRVDVALLPKNDLVIAFRSLTHALNQKRPRPRWKTNLVAHQQLRWQRTTLLGRIPGWSPPVAPVGPWRAVRFDASPLSDVRVSGHHRSSESVGVVTFRGRVHGPLDGVTFSIAGQAVPVSGDGDSCRVEVRIPNPPLWWPHTHGEPTLLDWSLDGPDLHERGKVGFRTVGAGDGRIAFRVNGVDVYCRGACWTVSDIVTLDGTPESLQRDLRLAKDAGINMLRVGGTMIYESDDFYRLCDELGILVWQDFMFANMDYPVDDPAFAANIEAEAVEQIARIEQHPCVAAYCGNSEVEQQAAMLGMPRETWSNRWFAERLPELIAAHHPGVPYVPSTPTGGVMPFHLREGVAHYYGVGAYLRPIGDVRKDDVGFTSECLGFANIPEPATLLALGDPPPHDPRWKERVPRDTGTGWDFDDVRDHYLKEFFDVDPVRLRSFDIDRYLRLSRVVPGEMMSRVFAEWRSTHSKNRGGLAWFYKDLWPGAGWGILDSHGTPKAPYYALRRAWRTRQIAITNEGLNGLHIHVINETAEEFRGRVELALIKDGHVIVARRDVECHVAARSNVMFQSDAMLDGFYDVAYAYRFGPPKHDISIATLLDERGESIGEAFDFPVAKEPAMLNANVAATVEICHGGVRVVRLTSDQFLFGASFDAKDFLPDDNYFHLSPLRPKTVRFTPRHADVRKFACYLEALNLRQGVKIA